jgi:D-alanyl-D-alanine dipeptidase
MQPAQTLPCEALAGHPDFRRLESIAGVAVDLRYAGPDNFVGRKLYGDLDCAWLHREAAAALEAVVDWLRQARPDLRLLVLDALRPHRVQQQLWQHLEGTDLRQYLADPARGSIHSFGMAVDVTLLDPSGAPLDMGTGFDDLSELSHPDMEVEHLEQGRLTPAQTENRLLLRAAMADCGFRGIHSEWWHFDCGDRDLIRQRYLRIE